MPNCNFIKCLTVSLKLVFSNRKPKQNLLIPRNIFYEQWLYLCLQFEEKEQEHVDEDLDYRALEDGFVSCNLFVYHLLVNLLSLIADSMVPFGTTGCNYSYVFKSSRLVRGSIIGVKLACCCTRR